MKLDLSALNYKYRIVTLDGELLHVGGSLTGGTVKNSTNMISQRHELEDNVKLLDELQLKRANLEMYINEIDSKYKTEIDEKDKLLEEETNLEISLRYEEERKKIFEEEKERLKYEINNLNDVINGSLSKEEEKIVSEYYEKEKEKQSLALNISSLKEVIDDYKNQIYNLDKESKINNQEFYKKSNELKELEIKVNRADVKLDTLLNTLTEDYSMTF